VIAQRRVGVGGAATISSIDQGGGKRRLFIASLRVTASRPREPLPVRVQQLCIPMGSSTRLRAG
jgi:hypothetical protein